ncbi:MAG TPA: hypothetical protein V6C81_26660 [Planktothrix sp.]|jgi:hypothetical protein
MENNKPLEQTNQHNPNLKADVHTVKMAWEAWEHSGNGRKEDQAEATLRSVAKSDPEAFKIAMHQIDRENARAKQAQQQRFDQQMQAGLNQQAWIDGQIAQNQQRQAQEAASAASPPPPIDLGTEVVTAPQHNGYAPTSDYAPAPPNTPGYEAGNADPPEEFHGLNLGILKIGGNGHGSAVFEGNIGLAKGGITVGKRLGGYAEAFPFANTPLHGRADAGIAFGDDGAKFYAGGGANVFGIVHADGDGALQLGNGIRVDGDANARVLGVGGSGAAGAGIDERGVGGYAGGNADAAGVVGGRAGGRVQLGPHSGIAGGGGVEVAGKTLDVGPSADAYPDGTGTGGVHIEPNTVGNRTFYPTGDREVDDTP